MPLEASEEEGSPEQGAGISRSHATDDFEPCQGRNAAALRRSVRVPWGCFGGVTYSANALAFAVDSGFTAKRGSFFFGKQEPRFLFVFFVMREVVHPLLCHFDRSEQRMFLCHFDRSEQRMFLCHFDRSERSPPSTCHFDRSERQRTERRNLEIPRLRSE